MNGRYIIFLITAIFFWSTDVLIADNINIISNQIGAINTSTNIIDFHESNTKDSNIILKEIIDNEKKNKYLEDRFKIIGEFGLGNIISVFGTYKIGKLNIGFGIGYLYRKIKDEKTAIHVIEPGFIFFNEPFFKVLMLRAKIGFDAVFEKRYNLRGFTTTISSEIILTWKGIYAGIGFPIVIGKNGVGITFSIGAGYMYSF